MDLETLANWLRQVEEELETLRAKRNQLLAMIEEQVRECPGRQACAGGYAFSVEERLKVRRSAQGTLFEEEVG